MSMEPPLFQEAARCDVCQCSFNTFRRRHHCRCCGRTLCYEHSSNQKALPHFGIHTPVRVCADCFNDSSLSGNNSNPQHSLDGADPVADSISRLDINDVVDSKIGQISEYQVAVASSDCKCGMPLCICEAPSPPKETRVYTSSSFIQTNPKPKKVETNQRNRASASNNRHSVIVPNQRIKSTSNDSRMDYECNGEGLREAIKNGDTDAVKKLLSEGVDSNYRDRQGSYLLHLAAVFNQADIVFALIERGASLDNKNAQGETPLDCAPVSLQFKIRKWVEGSKQ